MIIIMLTSNPEGIFIAQNLRRMNKNALLLGRTTYKYNMSDT